MGDFYAEQAERIEAYPDIIANRPDFGTDLLKRDKGQPPKRWLTNLVSTTSRLHDQSPRNYIYRSAVVHHVQCQYCCVEL